MNRLCAKICIEDLHVHDFRKAMTTWLVEQGVPYEVRTKTWHHLDGKADARSNGTLGRIRDALSFRARQHRAHDTQG
jgi:hypothetical protein